MAKISLRELETARKDPRAFRQSLGAVDDRFFPPDSYYRALRDTIARFHRSSSLQDARDYLNERLRKRFKRESRIAETLDTFEWYVRDYVRRGSASFESRMSLLVQLPAFVPRDLTCGGQVERVDLLAEGGYAAWVFRNDSVDGWENEIQFPLIQKTVADQLSAPWTEVSVGIYGFPDKTVETRLYSDREIRGAYRDLTRLLRTMGY